MTELGKLVIMYNLMREQEKIKKETNSVNSGISETIHNLNPFSEENTNTRHDNSSAKNEEEIREEVNDISGDSEIDDASETFEEVSKERKEPGSEIDGEKIEKFNKGIKNIKGAILGLDSRLKKVLKSTDEEIKKLKKDENRIINLIKHFGVLNEIFSPLDINFDNLNKYLTSVRKVISELIGNLNQINSSLKTGLNFNSDKYCGLLINPKTNSEDRKKIESKLEGHLEEIKIIKNQIPSLINVKTIGLIENQVHKKHLITNIQKFYEKVKKIGHEYNGIIREINGNYNNLLQEDKDNINRITIQIKSLLEGNFTEKNAFDQIEKPFDNLEAILINLKQKKRYSGKI